VGWDVEPIPPARSLLRVGATLPKVKALLHIRRLPLEVTTPQWYAAGAMPLPTPRRVALSLPLLAALCGALIGLAAFAVIAALWRVGAAHMAIPAAEAILLITLTGMATAILGAQPARIRRARVPIGRAVPHAWWPPQHDPVPLVAACVGAPIAAGVGAAMWLFH
jgi:hypothetical protein